MVNIGNIRKIRQAKSQGPHLEKSLALELVDGFEPPTC